MFANHFLSDSESLILLFLEGHCTVQENASSKLSRFSHCSSDGHRSDKKIASHSIKASEKKGGSTDMRSPRKENSLPCFTSSSSSSHRLVTPTLLNRTNAVMIAQNFFILEKLLRHYRSASPNSCCTERSLYYRDPQLFAGGQMGVRRCLHRISRSLDVCRALQVAFESEDRPKGVKDIGNAWWERRTPSLWTRMRCGSAADVSHKLFTTSFSSFFFFDCRSFTKTVEKPNRWKRPREGKEEEKNAVKWREDHGGVLPCAIPAHDTSLLPSPVSLDERECSFSEHLGSTLPVPVWGDAPEKIPCFPYSRERIGVMANGKSILVGYLAFDVEENVPFSGSSAAERFPTHSRSPPSSYVFSGLSNGTQGMLLTSDVVLRSTRFRGLSPFVDPPPTAPLLFPLQKEDTSLPSTKKSSHPTASQEETPLGCFSSAIPNAFPSFFSSPHILVIVEKECVLRTLLDTDHALLPPHSPTPRRDPYRSPPHDSMPPSFFVSSTLSSLPVSDRRFIFLCTKGYPCVASRLFLRRLHAAWPSLPLVAFTDGDPHGMAIVLSLMGVLSAPSSEAPPSASLFGNRRPPAAEILPGGPWATTAAPLLPLAWIGVKPSELMQQHTIASTPSSSGASYAPTDFHPSSQHPGFIPITPSDSKVLLRLQKCVEAYLHKNATESHTSSALQNRPQHHTPSCTTSTSSLHSLPIDVPNAVLQHSMQCLQQEIKWTQKNALKCEIQALHPEAPLSFLQRSLFSFCTRIHTA